MTKGRVRGKSLRLAAVLSAMAIILALCPVAAPVSAAKTEEELSKEIAALQKEQEELKKQISNNSGKLMIELHEIMSDTLDYSLDCSAGTVQQDYIMLRPIVMTFRTSTYAQARQIVDRLCSSENISQISDMNMNTYTEGRNSGTVETTLVITYFEIMS